MFQAVGFRNRRVARRDEDWIQPSLRVQLFDPDWDARLRSSHAAIRHGRRVLRHDFQLWFPSYELSFPIENKQPCLVPEPTVITDDVLADDVALESLESGLVRVMGYTMPTKFGPGLVVNNATAKTLGLAVRW